MILTLSTVHSTRPSLNHEIFREYQLRLTNEWLNTNGGREILANTSTVNTHIQHINIDPQNHT